MTAFRPGQSPPGKQTDLHIGSLWMFAPWGVVRAYITMTSANLVPECVLVGEVVLLVSILAVFGLCG